MKSKGRRIRKSNDYNKTYIKCEICGSTHISVLAISPKQTSSENNKVLDAKMGWLAICNNCSSQVIVTERWITPTKIVRDLSDIELSRNEDTDVFENGTHAVDVKKIEGLYEIIKEGLIENKDLK